MAYGIVQNPQAVRIIGDDETKAIVIVETGWDDLYHVITEDGEMQESKLENLTSSEILSKYGVSIFN